MEPTRDEIKAWLRDILERTGETPSALARRAGLATTTLTRFLDDTNSSIPHSRTLAKIAHAAHVAPIGLPTRDQAAGAKMLRENDAEPYRAAPHDPMAAMIDAHISGRNATDPWVMKSHCLELAGLIPGDIMIVDLNRKPVSGDVVCAQVYQWAAGTAETVFRLYEPPYLIAATLDQAQRRPLIVDSDRVIIKGVVVSSLRVRSSSRE